MTKLDSWQEKEVVEQILAEIKHYLEPTEAEIETKEFLSGLLCGLHAALASQPDFITNKEYLDAISWVGVEALKYRKP